VGAALSSSTFSIRPGSRRSCTKVIHRHARAILADQFFLKWRAGAEPKTFLVGQFVQRGVFRGREIGPIKPACQQILATVSHHVEERIVGLRDVVELAGNDSRHGRLGGNGPYPGAIVPQLFVAFVAFGKVTHYSREAPQGALFIFERRGNGVGPESRSVFSRLPVFAAHMTFGGGPFELLPQLHPESVVARIEETDGAVNGFIHRISVDAHCSGIPSRDAALNVQQVECVVLHPRRNVRR
jgi:hypothetical protein